MFHNHNASLLLGTKIQIHNFVIFYENWIFEHNLRFSDSVVLWSYSTFSKPIEPMMNGRSLSLRHLDNNKARGDASAEQEEK